MDVLASGPERSPRTRRGSARRLRVRWAAAIGPRPGRRSAARRRAVAAVVALLVVRAGVALRSAADPVDTAPAAAATSSTSAPDDLAASAPGPPYDWLPGRKPIPQPTPLAGGKVLRGSLPALGPAGRRAATTSAKLVLGRYCRRPGRYAVALDPEAGWRRLRALGSRTDRSTDGPWVVLELTWTGRAYSWTGSTVQLSNC